MTASTPSRHDAWSAGEHHERYIGRWSRRIAARHLDRLEAPRRSSYAALFIGQALPKRAALAVV